MQTSLSFVLTFLIRGYQYFISPVVPARCRFYPTCSAYSLEAVHRYGAFRGLWLGLQRLLKCHPWHDGGVDPVPQKYESGGVRKRKREPSCR